MQSNAFCRDFECSKVRDDYWDRSHSTIQLEDAIYFFFALFSANKFQLVLELDRSQCYKKNSDNDRAYKNFNLHPGMSARFSTSVKVNHDSIMPYSHGNAVKLGDITHRALRIANPPPKNTPTMP